MEGLSTGTEPTPSLSSTVYSINGTAGGATVLQVHTPVCRKYVWISCTRHTHDGRLRAVPSPTTGSSQSHPLRALVHAMGLCLGTVQAKGDGHQHDERQRVILDEYAA